MEGVVQDFALDAYQIKYQCQIITGVAVVLAPATSATEKLSHPAPLILNSGHH